MSISVHQCPSVSSSLIIINHAPLHPSVNIEVVESEFVERFGQHTQRLKRAIDVPLTQREHDLVLRL